MSATGLSQAVAYRVRLDGRVLRFRGRGVGDLGRMCGAVSSSLKLVRQPVRTGFVRTGFEDRAAP